MKIRHDRFARTATDSRRGRGRPALARSGGFTLVEILVTCMIALLIIGALLSSYMYGMRMFEIVKPKLSTSDEARNTISKLVQEIRSAVRVEVGTGGETQFTPAGVSARQEGNAIQIYPDIDRPTVFVRYFRDDTDNTLRRITSSMPESAVMARAITNAITFTAEDFAGRIFTNRTNNRVIGLHLNFSQLPHTTGKVGPGSLYDNYQLRTRITRRAIL